MPAVYAHYRFGREVLRALPEEERRLIRQGKDAFLLGLHGPDLLFYYYPVGKNRINRQGSRMHQEPAADFFKRGRERWLKEKSPALRAYLYGFLCHFLLDSECHPYISFYMQESKAGHMEIETEFDRYLMELDGRDPLEYIPIHHLISRAETRRQIAGMFDRVTPGQIHACIRGFRRTVSLFVCRSEGKRGVLKGLFSLAGQAGGLGGLIMDGRVNPACADSDLFLEERMRWTVQLAAEELAHYSRALEQGGPLSKRLCRNYEE